MQLLDDEIRHFEVFGFIVHRRTFGPAEMTRIIDAAMTILEEDQGEAAWTGTERQQIQGFVERHPTLSALITDDHIYDPVAQLLDQGPVWIGSDGNRYVGETGWHPDGSYPGYRRIKVALYLDVLRRDTGALRVVPGSHKNPLHDELRVLLQRFDTTITPYGVMASFRTNPTETGTGVPPTEVPCYAVDTDPGDVVFFDQNIWHASFGGEAGRRMFTLNFGASPQTEEQWTFLERMYRGQLEHVRVRQRGKRTRIYPDHLLNGPEPRLRQLFGPLAARGWR